MQLCPDSKMPPPINMHTVPFNYNALPCKHVDFFFFFTLDYHDTAIKTQYWLNIHNQTVGVLLCIIYPILFTAGNNYLHTATRK